MSCNFKRFLIFRSVSAQSVLQFVTKLGQYAVGNVTGKLGDEVNTNAFGANQANDLFNFIKQGTGRIFENEMCFVEEENHLGFFKVASFRHHFVQFREHPQKEGGIQKRALEEFSAMEHIDYAIAFFVLSKPVLNFQCRLTKEHITALVFQSKQCALDSANTLCRNITILGFQGSSVFANILHHAAQIF